MDPASEMEFILTRSKEIMDQWKNPKEEWDADQWLDAATELADAVLDLHEWAEEHGYLPSFAGRAQREGAKSAPELAQAVLEQEKLYRADEHVDMSDFMELSAQLARAVQRTTKEGRTAMKNRKRQRQAALADTDTIEEFASDRAWEWASQNLEEWPHDEDRYKMDIGQVIGENQELLVAMKRCNLLDEDFNPQPFFANHLDKFMDFLKANWENFYGYGDIDYEVLNPAVEQWAEEYASMAQSALEEKVEGLSEEQEEEALEYLLSNDATWSVFLSDEGWTDGIGENQRLSELMDELGLDEYDLLPSGSGHGDAISNASLEASWPAIQYGYEQGLEAYLEKHCKDVTPVDPRQQELGLEAKTQRKGKNTMRTRYRRDREEDHRAEARRRLARYRVRRMMARMNEEEEDRPVRRRRRPRVAAERKILPADMVLLEQAINQLKKVKDPDEIIMTLRDVRDSADDILKSVSARVRAAARMERPRRRMPRRRRFRR